MKPISLKILLISILRYNQQYPNVAFPISQVTGFDHRLGKVVAENKTSSGGSFEIENIPAGEYNFAAQKEGYGWRYIYNVPINSGSTTQLPNNSTIQQQKVSNSFLSFNLFSVK